MKAVLSFLTPKQELSSDIFSASVAVRTANESCDSWKTKVSKNWFFSVLQCKHFVDTSAVNLWASRILPKIFLQHKIDENIPGVLGTKGPSTLCITFLFGQCNSTLPKPRLRVRVALVARGRRRGQHRSGRGGAHLGDGVEEDAGGAGGPG